VQEDPLRQLVLTIVIALVVGVTAARAQSPVERGRYLVNTVMTCQNCHTPKGPAGDIADKAFSGGLTFDEPPFTVTASNITQDRDTGIGKWTEAELKSFMTTGVRPNGVPVAPLMPTGYYKILTPGDLNAVVAYLRTISPIRNEVVGPVYRAPMQQEVFPGAEKPISPADLNNKVKRGFYLATIAHCMECHTPMDKGHHLFGTRLGTGGQKFPGPWGESTARNITSHKIAGLGAWSDAEIKRAITHGIRKDGTRLKPPMGYGYYAKMTDPDLDAVVAWLRTVPPLE
jgi:mono/diheme cytochrome c family protein